MSAIRSSRARRRSSLCNPCLIMFLSTFLLVFYRTKIKELFPQSASMLSVLEWAGNQLLLGFSAGLFLSGVGLFVSLLRDGKRYLFSSADTADDTTMSDGELQSLEAGLLPVSASSDVPSPSSESTQPIADSPSTSQSQSRPLSTPGSVDSTDLLSPAVTFGPLAKLLCMALCSASVCVDLWLRGILSSRNPPATALEVMTKVLKHLLAGVEVLSVVSMVLLAFIAWKTWRPGRSRWATPRDSDEELELVEGEFEGEDKGIEDVDGEGGNSKPEEVRPSGREHEDQGRETQEVNGEQ